MISSTETVTVHETSNGNVVKTSPDVAVGMVRLDATEEDAPGGRSKYGKLIDQYGNDFEVPEYTFKQIRDAIPPHCFERSALKGYRFVVQDLTLLTLTFLGFSKYLTPENVPSWSARFALWTLYTVLQGIFGIGVWVDAHECGHQAFSESRLINDVTGWVLHSFLLVPYFSWKLSHKQHHALHNNVAKDIQFVPKTRENYGEYHEKNIHSGWEFTEDTPLYTAATLIGQQLIGWPYYLLTNDSGTENYRNRPDGRGIGKHNGFGGGVNHYDPRSPLYSANEWHLILLSDLGLAITIGGVLYVGANYGWANVLVWYVIPYLWVNHWLVAIAYLHHTDPSLPHYTPETWSFVRGAAATIDRDFGFIGHYFFHDIIETHVLHHTISTIPFYHAREATDAIKSVMGKHYRSDGKSGVTGFFKSLWRSARWCQWVEECDTAEGPGKSVLFFRNSNGLGIPPMKKRA